MSRHDQTTRSRHLRCAHCGRLITRLEWDAFKFSDTYKCCKQMHLQPFKLKEPTHAR
jgi:phage FluMu protein Com